MMEMYLKLQNINQNTSGNNMMDGCPIGLAVTQLQAPLNRNARG